MTRAAMVLLLLAACISHVLGDFNQCLGIEIYRLPTIKDCGRLYDACHVGVSKLNVQLKMPRRSLFHPVSLVSATESTAKSSTESMIAMLVQLAPVEYCNHSVAAPRNSTSPGEKCTFDMTKIEIYSILLRQENPRSPWSLDGYKHHALSVEDRTQIVAEYKSGHFFGTNLAIGIFDTPNLPAQVASDSVDKTMARSPVAVFAVLVSATVSIGLLFHHRRRLHNGYAPIVVMKRAQLQARSLRRPTSGDAGEKVPPSITTEEASLKQETHERFAV